MELLFSDKNSQGFLVVSAALSAITVTEWNNLGPLGLDFLQILSQPNFWIWIVVSTTTTTTKSKVTIFLEFSRNAETVEITTKFLKKKKKYTYICKLLFWPTPTPSTTWSSSCIHLFKQLKNNETFLDIPAIAFYPSALAAAWQLSLDLQNKPTLWRKHCKLLEPACWPAKWLIWVWNQSQCW